MTAGHLDSSFGLFGTAGASIGGEHAEANAVAIQPDGRIVVAGLASHAGVSALAVARFLSNGRLDPSFGGGAGLLPGELRIPLARGQSRANAIALQPDGKIVIGGSIAVSTAGDTIMFVARLMADGTLDRGFAVGGVALVESLRNGAVNGLAILGSGRIIAVGPSLADHTLAFSLVGFRGDGSLDPAFGTAGFVRTVIGLASTFLAPVPFAVVDQAVGIVLAGRAIIGTGTSGVLQPAFARYKPDGSLDSSFGDHGILSIAPGHRSQCVALAVSANYYILAGGDTSDGPVDFLATVLEARTGRPIFSPGPALTMSFGDLGYSQAYARGCAVHNDGQTEHWLLAGSVSDGAKRNIGLVRYQFNGTLDTSFSGGRVVTSFISGPCEVTGVAIQHSDRKIVVVCTADYGTTKIFGLARYLGV